VPYIYRYFDKNDGIYKYVGITKSWKGLEHRVQRHKKDYWFGNGKWTVEYAFVESMTDLHMLEGHFISDYETYNWYNKAKSSWGKSRMFQVPSLQWSVYAMRINPIKYCNDIEELRAIATAQQEEIEIAQRTARTEKRRSNELEKRLKCAEDGLKKQEGENALLSAKVESLTIENENLSRTNLSASKSDSQVRIGVKYKNSEIAEFSNKARRASASQTCKLFQDDFYGKVARGDIDTSKVGDARQQDAFMQGVDYVCDNLYKIFSGNCYR